MKIELKLKTVSSMEELTKVEKEEMILRLGLLYFHLLTDGGINTHVITEKSNPKWLQSMVNQNRIFLPIQCIVAEYN